MKKLSLPTIERLSILYTMLESLECPSISVVSSVKLGEMMNVTPHTIRKDINCLGQLGDEYGYDIQNLKEIIKKSISFDMTRKACIVGLGRLGSALINFEGFMNSHIKLIAGFDSRINRLETLHSHIPLYAASEIPKIIKRDGIELGVIAVPPTAADLTAKRLIEGGIKGIINFAPIILKDSNSNIPIRNLFVIEEFRILSALISKQERLQDK